MTRQSATQHLDVLVRAGLVTVVRRGRERLQALSAVEDRAEERAVAEVPTSVPTCVHVTSIHASAGQVWRALTDADLTARCWGHADVSDWQPGSTWEHRRTDGEPPSGPSVVTFLVEPSSDVVRLTVTHEGLADRTALGEVSHGWPAVLANLESLLETGQVLPQAPWDVAPARA